MSPMAAGAGENASIGVGVLGFGNVGGSLIALIADHADMIGARAGVALRVERVGVRDVTKDRPVALAEGVLTADAAAVVADPAVDVVVEVIGGIEPARTLILDALARGKPVVTANKELLANAGKELFEAAERAGVDLLFEASVAGGVPLIRPLRESLAGEKIQRLTGIVNGTTNFILTRMSEEGSSFAAALAEAQALGYAESDPTADVEGYDAAAKAAILASIAFGADVVASDVYREGIAEITPADIAAAHDLGYVVKLLAVAEDLDGSIAVRVHPAMIPAQHPLASVRGSFNAVFIEGASVGELMLYGRGAGGGPTAVSVLGDLVDAAKNLRSGAKGATFGTPTRIPIHPIDEVESQFYMTVDVADRPGVLAAIAGVFGKFAVSIQSMQQQGRGDEAHLIFVTHLAREADLRATMDEVGELDAVERVGSVLRVVGGAG
jgi:homoserine dehydrogenase